MTENLFWPRIKEILAKKFWEKFVKDISHGIWNKPEKLSFKGKQEVWNNEPPTLMKKE